LFITEAEGSELMHATTDTFPQIYVEFSKMGKIERAPLEIDIEKFIGVKGLKAKGKKMAPHPPKKITVLDSLPEPEIEETPEAATEPSGAPTEKPTIVADLDADDPQIELFDEE
jgi:topoisomerase-4 subunit A